MKLHVSRQLIVYLVKFFVIFCLLYFGTEAVEGLAAPDHYYSPFIQHYLDYPSWLRASLLIGSKILLSVFGYNAIIPDHYHLQIVNGVSVQLIYACLGIGVSSFWFAFVVANKGSWKKKSLWVAGGLLIIWLINIVRISLVLLANDSGRAMPLGLDNHTFFNVLAYVAIFGLIYFYDRSPPPPPKGGTDRSEETPSATRVIS